MNKTDSTEITKLEIAIYVYNAYLEGLRLVKQQTTSEKTKKEIKKLTKEAKLHYKKLHKLYNKMLKMSDKESIATVKTEDIEAEDKITETVDVKTEETKAEAEETKAEATSKKVNTEDSTKHRDEVLENTKKAGNTDKAEHTDTVLDNINCDYAIEKEQDKLPVECEMLKVKCVFTPQHSMIIKSGSVVPSCFIDDTSKLSKLTASNIKKALLREALIDVRGEDDEKLYLVKEDFTCSSRWDAARIIKGDFNIKGCNFYVGDMTLAKYILKGK